MINFFKLPNSKYFCFWFVSFYVLNFVGCINYGPISLKSERSRYNLAIQKTNDEQLLLNLVRLKYRDTPFFMEVSNVASQFSLKSQASISAQLESIVEDIFDMRPYAIETRFNLRTPIYSETAAYGHMGRTYRHIQ